MFTPTSNTRKKKLRAAYGNRVSRGAANRLRREQEGRNRAERKFIVTMIADILDEVDFRAQNIV